MRIFQRQLNAVDFKVSSDLRYVLLISDITPVYKYTTLARYHVVEVATTLKFPLSWKEDDDNAPFLQYATWSPDGIAVAFVYNNDVYYKPRVNMSLICRITKNGIPGMCRMVQFIYCVAFSFAIGCRDKMLSFYAGL